MTNSADPALNPATPAKPGNAIIAYFRDFNVLRETRKEYWGIQIVNFLDNTFYFALLTIATLFLSEDLGLNDKQAGYSTAIFTSATSLMLFFSGLYTDWLGIRKSLQLSMVGMLFLRLGVVIVGLMPGLPHRGIIASVLLLLMAPFMAGIQTVFQAACQRYTTRRSRSAGFNLWYLFMNIGAAAAGFSIDIVRKWLGLANVHIFSMGVILAVLCIVVAMFLIRTEDQLIGPNDPPEPETAKAPKKSPFQMLVDVFREPAVWRLLVLIALIIGVRAVYSYLYLLMPKYWLRTIGPDAAIGTLNAVNPIGIIIGLILFIPITNKFKVFDMLIYGAMISAFSLFPMALPWEWTAPFKLAIDKGLVFGFSLFGYAPPESWLGNSISQAHYIMALACMVILTIGEVVWSPKLYEYTAAIAPKGQEGTYLGLSLVPWFVAKTLVSAFSGHLLEYWSPETVEVNGVKEPLQQALIQHQLPYWHTPAAMWMVLGLYGLAGCILALFLKRWFTRDAHFKDEDKNKKPDKKEDSDK